ncbi:MAG: cysteine peptidase family C39 domain-containing protein, partial [Candidatus Omnitrophota bacterium]
MFNRLDKYNNLDSDDSDRFDEYDGSKGSDDSGFDGSDDSGFDGSDFEPEKQPQEQEPFKSRFKSWIRTAALIVVLVFVPEQISWAINYNPYVLHKRQAAHYVDPDASKEDLTSARIAGNVEYFLRQISYQQNPELRLRLTNNNLSGAESDSTAPSILITSQRFYTDREIDTIYNWLREPSIYPLNCSIYALKDILTSHEIDTTLEELSVVSLLADLMNDIIRPGEPKLKTSLFAINEVAKAYGLDYKALKVLPYELWTIKTPFMANLKSEHFVMVTGMDEENVYYTDIGQAKFMPRDVFSNEFSGFVLAPPSDNLQEARLVSESMMAFVWGSQYRHREGNLPGLYTNSDMLAFGAMTALSFAMSVDMNQYFVQSGANELFGAFAEWKVATGKWDVDDAALFTTVGSSAVGMGYKGFSKPQTEIPYAPYSTGQKIGHMFEGMGIGGLDGFSKYYLNKLIIDPVTDKITERLDIHSDIVNQGIKMLLTRAISAPLRIASLKMIDFAGDKLLPGFDKGWYQDWWASAEIKDGQQVKFSDMGLFDSMWSEFSSPDNLTSMLYTAGSTTVQYSYKQLIDPDYDPSKDLLAGALMDWTIMELSEMGLKYLAPDYYRQMKEEENKIREDAKKLGKEIGATGWKLLAQKGLKVMELSIIALAYQSLMRKYVKTSKNDDKPFTPMEFHALAFFTTSLASGTIGALLGREDDTSGGDVEDPSFFKKVWSNFSVELSNMSNSYFSYAGSAPAAGQGWKLQDWDRFIDKSVEFTGFTPEFAKQMNSTYDMMKRQNAISSDPKSDEELDRQFRQLVMDSLSASRLNAATYMFQELAKASVHNFYDGLSFVGTRIAGNHFSPHWMGLDSRFWNKGKINSTGTAEKEATKVVMYTLGVQPVGSLIQIHYNVSGSWNPRKIAAPIGMIFDPHEETSGRETSGGGPGLRLLLSTGVEKKILFRNEEAGDSLQNGFQEKFQLSTDSSFASSQESSLASKKRLFIKYFSERENNIRGWAKYDLSLNPPKGLDERFAAKGISEGGTIVSYIYDLNDPRSAQDKSHELSNLILLGPQERGKPSFFIFSQETDAGLEKIGDLSVVMNHEFKDGNTLALNYQKVRMVDGSSVILYNRSAGQKGKDASAYVNLMVSPADFAAKAMAGQGFSIHLFNLDGNIIMAKAGKTGGENDESGTTIKMPANEIDLTFPNANGNNISLALLSKMLTDNKNQEFLALAKEKEFYGRLKENPELLLASLDTSISREVWESIWSSEESKKKQPDNYYATRGSKYGEILIENENGDIEKLDLMDVLFSFSEGKNPQGLLVGSLGLDFLGVAKNGANVSVYASGDYLRENFGENYRQGAENALQGPTAQADPDSLNIRVDDPKGDVGGFEQDQENDKFAWRLRKAGDQVYFHGPRLSPLEDPMGVRNENIARPYWKAGLVYKNEMPHGAEMTLPVGLDQYGSLSIAQITKVTGKDGTNSYKVYNPETKQEETVQTTDEYLLQLGRTAMNIGGSQVVDHFISYGRSSEREENLEFKGKHLSLGFGKGFVKVADKSLSEDQTQIVEKLSMPQMKGATYGNNFIDGRHMDSKEITDGFKLKKNIVSNESLKRAVTGLNREYSDILENLLMQASDIDENAGIDDLRQKAGAIDEATASADELKFKKAVGQLSGAWENKDFQKIEKFSTRFDSDKDQNDREDKDAFHFSQEDQDKIDQSISDYKSKKAAGQLWGATDINVITKAMWNLGTEDREKVQKALADERYRSVPLVIEGDWVDRSHEDQTDFSFVTIKATTYNKDGIPKEVVLRDPRKYAKSLDFVIPESGLYVTGSDGELKDFAGSPDGEYTTYSGRMEFTIDGNSPSNLKSHQFTPGAYWKLPAVAGNAKDGDFNRYMTRDWKWSSGKGAQGAIYVDLAGRAIGEFGVGKDTVSRLPFISQNVSSRTQRTPTYLLVLLIGADPQILEEQNVASLLNAEGGQEVLNKLGEYLRKIGVSKVDVELAKQSLKAGEYDKFYSDYYTQEVRQSTGLDLSGDKDKAFLLAEHSAKIKYGGDFLWKRGAAWTPYHGFDSAGGLSNNDGTKPYMLETMYTLGKDGRKKIVYQEKNSDIDIILGPYRDPILVADHLTNFSFVAAGEGESALHQGTVQVEALKDGQGNDITPFFNKYTAIATGEDQDSVAPGKFVLQTGMIREDGSEQMNVDQVFAARRYITTEKGAYLGLPGLGLRKYSPGEKGGPVIHYMPQATADGQTIDVPLVLEGTKEETVFGELHAGIVPDDYKEGKYSGSVFLKSFAKGSSFTRGENKGFAINGVIVGYNGADIPDEGTEVSVSPLIISDGGKTHALAYSGQKGGYWSKKDESWIHQWANEAGDKSSFDVAVRNINTGDADPDKSKGLESKFPESVDKELNKPENRYIHSNITLMNNEPKRSFTLSGVNYDVHKAQITSLSAYDSSFGSIASPGAFILPTKAGIVSGGVTQTVSKEAADKALAGLTQRLFDPSENYEKIQEAIKNIETFISESTLKDGQYSYRHGKEGKPFDLNGIKLFKGNDDDQAGLYFDGKKMYALVGTWLKQESVTDPSKPEIGNFKDGQPIDPSKPWTETFGKTEMVGKIIDEGVNQFAYKSQLRNLTTISHKDQYAADQSAETARNTIDALPNQSPLMIALDNMGLLELSLSNSDELQLDSDATFVTPSPAAQDMSLNKFDKMSRDLTDEIALIFTAPGQATDLQDTSLEEFTEMNNGILNEMVSIGEEHDRQINQKVSHPGYENGQITQHIEDFAIVIGSNDTQDLMTPMTTLNENGETVTTGMRGNIHKIAYIPIEFTSKAADGAEGTLGAVSLLQGKDGSMNIRARQGKWVTYENPYDIKSSEDATQKASDSMTEHPSGGASRTAAYSSIRGYTILDLDRDIGPGGAVAYDQHGNVMPFEAFSPLANGYSPHLDFSYINPFSAIMGEGSVVWLPAGEYSRAAVDQEVKNADGTITTKREDNQIVNLNAEGFPLGYRLKREKGNLVRDYSDSVVKRPVQGIERYFVTKAAESVPLLNTTSTASLFNKNDDYLGNTGKDETMGIEEPQLEVKEKIKYTVDTQAVNHAYEIVYEGSVKGKAAIVQPLTPEEMDYITGNILENNALRYKGVRKFTNLGGPDQKTGEIRYGFLPMANKFITLEGGKIISDQIDTETGKNIVIDLKSGGFSRGWGYKYDIVSQEKEERINESGQVNDAPRFNIVRRDPSGWGPLASGKIYASDKPALRDAYQQVFRQLSYEYWLSKRTDGSQIVSTIKKFLGLGTDDNGINKDQTKKNKENLSTMGTVVDTQKATWDEKDYSITFDNALLVYGDVDTRRDSPTFGRVIFESTLTLPGTIVEDPAILDMNLLELAEKRDLIWGSSVKAKMTFLVSHDIIKDLVERGELPDDFELIDEPVLISRDRVLPDGSVKTLEAIVSQETVNDARGTDRKVFGIIPTPGPEYAHIIPWIGLLWTPKIQVHIGNEIETLTFEPNDLPKFLSDISDEPESERVPITEEHALDFKDFTLKSDYRSPGDESSEWISSLTLGMENSVENDFTTFAQGNAGSIDGNNMGRFASVMVKNGYTEFRPLVETSIQLNRQAEVATITDIGLTALTIADIASQFFAPHAPVSPAAIEAAGAAAKLSARSIASKIFGNRVMSSAIGRYAADRAVMTGAAVAGTGAINLVSYLQDGKTLSAEDNIRMVVGLVSQQALIKNLEKAVEAIGAAKNLSPLAQRVIAYGASGTITGINYVAADIISGQYKDSSNSLMKSFATGFGIGLLTHGAGRLLTGKRPLKFLEKLANPKTKLYFRAPVMAGLYLAAFEAASLLQTHTLINPFDEPVALALIGLAGVGTGLLGPRSLLNLATKMGKEGQLATTLAIATGAAGFANAGAIWETVKTTGLDRIGILGHSEEELYDPSGNKISYLSRLGGAYAGGLQTGPYMGMVVGGLMRSTTNPYWVESGLAGSPIAIGKAVWRVKNPLKLFNKSIREETFEHVAAGGPLLSRIPVIGKQVAKMDNLSMFIGASDAIERYGLSALETYAREKYGINLFNEGDEGKQAKSHASFAITLFLFGSYASTQAKGESDIVGAGKYENARKAAAEDPPARNSRDRNDQGQLVEVAPPSPRTTESSPSGLVDASGNPIQRASRSAQPTFTDTNGNTISSSSPSIFKRVRRTITDSKPVRSIRSRFIEPMDRRILQARSLRDARKAIGAVKQYKTIDSIKEKSGLNTRQIELAEMILDTKTDFEKRTGETFEFNTNQASLQGIGMRLFERSYSGAKNVREIMNWFASKGKSTAAFPLMKAIARKYPNAKVIFTTSFNNIDAALKGLEGIPVNRILFDAQNKPTNLRKGITVVETSELLELAAHEKLKDTFIIADEPQDGFQSPTLVFGSEKGLGKQLIQIEQFRTQYGNERSYDAALLSIARRHAGEIINKTLESGHVVRVQFQFSEPAKRAIVEQFKKTPEFKLTERNDQQIDALLDGAADAIKGKDITYRVNQDSQTGRMSGYETMEVRKGKVVKNTHFGDEGMGLNARARMIAVNEKAPLDVYVDGVMNKTKSATTYSDALTQAEGFIGLTATAKGFNPTFKTLRANIWKIGRKGELDIADLSENLNITLDWHSSGKPESIVEKVNNIIHPSNSKIGKSKIPNLLLVSNNDAAVRKAVALRMSSDPRFKDIEILVEGKELSISKIESRIESNPNQERVVIAQFYDGVNLAKQTIKVDSNTRAQVVLTNVASTADAVQTFLRVASHDSVRGRRIKGQADYAVSIRDFRLTHVERAELMKIAEKIDSANAKIASLQEGSRDYKKTSSEKSVQEALLRRKLIGISDVILAETNISNIQIASRSSRGTKTHSRDQLFKLVEQYNTDIQNKRDASFLRDNTGQTSVNRSLPSNKGFETYVADGKGSVKAISQTAVSAPIDFTHGSQLMPGETINHQSILLANQAIPAKIITQQNENGEVAPVKLMYTTIDQNSQNNTPFTNAFVPITNNQYTVDFKQNIASDIQVTGRVFEITDVQTGEQKLAGYRLKTSRNSTTPLDKIGIPYTKVGDQIQISRDTVNKLMPHDLIEDILSVAQNKTLQFAFSTDSVTPITVDTKAKKVSNTKIAIDAARANVEKLELILDNTSLLIDQADQLGLNPAGIQRDLADIQGTRDLIKDMLDSQKGSKNLFLIDSQVANDIPAAIQQAQKQEGLTSAESIAFDLGFGLKTFGGHAGTSHTKNQQNIYLYGASPDFADTIEHEGISLVANLKHDKAVALQGRIAKYQSHLRGIETKADVSSDIASVSSDVSSSGKRRDQASLVEVAAQPRMTVQTPATAHTQPITSLNDLYRSSGFFEAVQAIAREDAVSALEIIDRLTAQEKNNLHAATGDQVNIARIRFNATQGLRAVAEQIIEDELQGLEPIIPLWISEAANQQPISRGTSGMPSPAAPVFNAQKLQKPNLTNPLTTEQQEWFQELYAYAERFSTTHTAIGKLGRNLLNQEEILGLLADEIDGLVRRFDPSRGTLLVTLAGPRFEGAIKDAVRTDRGLNEKLKYTHLSLADTLDRKGDDKDLTVEASLKSKTDPYLDPLMQLNGERSRLERIKSFLEEHNGQIYPERTKEEVKRIFGVTRNTLESEIRRTPALAIVFDQLREARPILEALEKEGRDTGKAAESLGFSHPALVEKMAANPYLAQTLADIQRVEAEAEREIQTITAALKETGGIKYKTAELLRISDKTLKERIARHGLEDLVMNL